MDAIKVIIVIENKLQGEFLKMIFEGDAYEVTLCYDGEEAFHYLLEKKELEAVVIMSYQLPKKDGITIMKELRAAGVDYAYIFLTSDKTIERAIEAMKAGAMDFIPKSNNLQNELLPLVNQTYQRKMRRLAHEKLSYELEEKNKSIANSIEYAKRIQGALLPPLKFIYHLIPEHFILFLPRDVVSGDFYWFSQREHYIIMAAADCTGHGVPGAFMSMLGMTGLNQIVHFELAGTALKAHDILNRLRDFVIKSLHQTGKSGEAQDGMDMSLCVIDINQRNINFSGANNPLYLVRNNELTIYEANKMPIGIHKKNKDSFTSETFDFQQDDIIYLFSDGYMDQFGGHEGRKFMSKNFRDLLKSVSSLPLANQKVIIEDTLDGWKGNHKQIDDILVMGFKCTFSALHKYDTTEIKTMAEKTILIVEDDDNSAFLIEETLEETQVKTIRVRNGKEAVDICKKDVAIDLILMDIHMPLMDGNEAIQRIKEIRPTLKIIAQTAHDKSGEKEKTFKAGCDDYISKPLNINKLLTLVYKHTL